MIFADSHVHLAMPAIGSDLPEVLARARQSGVTRMMTCATSMADAEANIALARDHADSGLVAAVGFHPHQARDWSEGSEVELSKAIDASPQVAAIGEVGLDFHYNLSPPHRQTEALRRQIALARSTGLPLVVHCRKARDELSRILVEEKARDAGGVIHCFTEDAAFARFCLGLGFYVSFSGILTFKNAEEIRAAAKVVPLDRILVETDSPYLAPAPHRGRRNEPARVVDVARAVAELRNMTLADFASATSSNFEALFARRHRSGESPHPSG